ncbi:unnamed protein product [Oppiella nova]|uniref:RHD domain-containing protein n=1 Tax=Oppiella nova TaxID=334625 RepID=A0A7R9LZE1_9ACAR|nr:unnamed protein product [Oppiella nova]CAG2168475.1 unnamed protein product [Oppiella nova]
MSDNSHTGPYVRIVEQPARSAVRFRYECEGRSAGPIPGVSSTPSCATYPTIQIVNYRGSRAMVVVSCVTVSPPYRQHPHHLVGRVGCHQGVCTLIVDNTDHLCSFTHLGIQCAKRNEISSRLKLRKQLRVDPTSAGFDHIMKSSRSLDLGAIRLCFQAYIEDPVTRKFTRPLAPVVSDPVYDKKLLPKLIITDISTTCAPITGGKVMLFCNYIDEEDIEVRFYELDTTGAVVWESIADLKPPVGEVHKRVGISLMAPGYPYSDDMSGGKPVPVYLQLRRPSDQRSSDPVVFTYLPDCPYENCPLALYQRLHRHQSQGNSNSESLSTTTTTTTTGHNHHNHQHQQPTISSKRGRMKPTTGAKDSYTTNDDNNRDMNCKKRVKVLNVLNASDSEDMEGSDDGVDEDMTPTAGDRDVYHGISQYYSQNSQYFGANCLHKPDVNNNHMNGNQLAIKCEPSGGQTDCQFPDSGGALMSVNAASNDLLMECLKTIDIDCLAAMQFTAPGAPDYHHNPIHTTNNTYTTGDDEDWGSSLQQTAGAPHYHSDNSYTYSDYNDSMAYYQNQPPVLDSQDKLSFIDL